MNDIRFEDNAFGLYTNTFVSEKVIFYLPIFLEKLSLKHKLNTSPIISALLLTSVCLFFRVPVSKFLDFTLVRTFFSHFEGGIWIDKLLIFLLIGGVIWISAEQSVTFLTKVFTFGLLIYFIQKNNDYWKFYKTTLFPELAYWDIVAFSILLIFPIYYLLKYIVAKNGDKVICEGFLEDSTVTTYEDDHFKRSSVAAEIARLIKGTNNLKSLAIGILGEYGSGKTSFLNLINLNLVDDQILRVAFDPWTAATPEVIRREFFDVLAEKVASRDLRVSSMIYSYGRKLASFDSRSASLLNWLGFFSNGSSTQSSGEYDQINKKLIDSGLKVIVTIDDLDRLYPAEIVEVLKIIRNTANFSNVVYLVGYDKVYVQSAIKTLNNSANDFLDKIFQLEVPLPKRELDDLVLILRNNLKDLISVEHFRILEDTMIPNGFRNRYEKAYKGILRQGRDVIRFVNSFKLTYNLIGEEVDFECLILLELIKFRYPAIYDLIYTQRDIFLDEISVRSTYEQYFTPRIFTERNLKNNTEEISIFRKHLEQLNLSAEDVSLLNGLFMTLFKDNPNQRSIAKNSISYPLYYEIYFRYRLSQTDLSDKDYKAAKASGKMREFMKYCATHGLHKELMMRFMQEDLSKDRQHFENVIMWIFSYGRTLTDKEGLFHFDYIALLDKLYNYHKHITDNLYRKDEERYRKFINNLFGIAWAPFLFENQLIRHIKDKGGDFIVSVSELTRHQYSYFTQMASSGHELSSDTLWLFWGARETYRIPADKSGSYSENWRFEPELVDKMIEYLAVLDPKEFLKFSIQNEIWNSHLSCISPQVLEMFTDPTEYRDLIVKNPVLNEHIRDEYLKLFDKLSANGFTKYVEIDFETELRKKASL